MTSQYIVASNSAHDGTKVPHPDVSTGSGVDLGATANIGATPTMATLAASMQSTPGFYSRGLLYDSDVVVINCGPDKKKRAYAAPMQPAASPPDRAKKLAKEPVGEARGYEEIRARIGKGKK